MPPRFHLALPLQAGLQLTLPEGASRHVQVLRLQPTDRIVLFNGEGSDWLAQVTHMGRREVQVQIEERLPAREVEMQRHVTLAVGMPANERMDNLIEKATELGVARIQPLVCERSVLRLSGERAERKQAHWQAVAIAACEQSGRTRVPDVAPPRALSPWLAEFAGVAPGADEMRVVLSTGEAPALAAPGAAQRRLLALSGPEGGLSANEEALAVSAGFLPVSLGPRVLRADTAPLAALAWWGMSEWDRA